MQPGDKIVFDKYKWRVLDIQNNTALIITENIIEQRAYHNDMRLNISKNNTNVIEHEVYYFGLSDYPHFKISELKDIIAFIKYERLHGRQTEIVCQDQNILQIANDAVSNPDTILKISEPVKNAYVYHATDVNAAQKILSGGKLLSAEKVYGKTGEELSFEKRDSLWNDRA